MQLFPSNCSTIQLIQSKEIWGKNTAKKIKKTWKMAKWDFAWILMLHVERRRKTHAWLNAIKTKNAFVKDWINFSSKITTATNAHAMESPLDNWLKNTHIIVCITTFYFVACLNHHFVHYLKSPFESSDFYRFWFPNLLLNWITNSQRSKETPYSFVASKVQDMAF